MLSKRDANRADRRQAIADLEARWRAAQHVALRYAPEIPAGVRYDGQPLTPSGRLLRVEQSILKQAQAETRRLRALRTKRVSKVKARPRVEPPCPPHLAAEAQARAEAKARLHVSKREAEDIARVRRWLES